MTARPPLRASSSSAARRSRRTTTTRARYESSPTRRVICSAWWSTRTVPARADPAGTPNGGTAWVAGAAQVPLRKASMIGTSQSATWRASSRLTHRRQACCGTYPSAAHAACPSVSSSRTIASTRRAPCAAKRSSAAAMRSLAMPCLRRSARTAMRYRWQRQPSQPATTDPTISLPSTARMTASGSWSRSRPTDTRSSSLSVPSAEERQKPSRGAMSPVTAVRTT